MERHRVSILPIAQDDLRDVVEYLNTLSPQAALEHYDLMVAKIESLAEMPQRCPLCKDAQLRLRGYRILPVLNYLVFFVVRNDTVEIRRILYAKRQYEALL